MPTSITQIGDKCFEGCESLIDIELNYGIESIGDFCFANCSALERITIPISVKTIGGGCFYGCKSLIEFIDRSQESVYREGVMFSNNYGFFEDCRSLININISENIIELGNRCFYGCTKLHSIKFPSNIEIIGELCLCGNKINKLTIPSKVKFIGKDCLLANYYLKEIICEPITPPITPGFTDDYNITLYVPNNSIDSYKSDLIWGNCKVVLPIENTAIYKIKDSSVNIQSDGGFINISGLDDNEMVDFFGVDGKVLGSAKSIDGSVSFSAKQGTVVVAKIGKESVKIAVE